MNKQISPIIAFSIIILIAGIAGAAFFLFNREIKEVLVFEEGVAEDPEVKDVEAEESGAEEPEIKKSEEEKYFKIKEKDITWNCGSDFIDERDEQIYTTVEIGNQCWMAENLNYDDGCSLVQLDGRTDVGWCGYHEDAKGTQYGMLYQWSALQVICSEGWRVATDEDWKILEGAVDSEYGIGNSIWNKDGWQRGSDVSDKLKEVSFRGNNRSGFGVMAGGFMDTGFESNFMWLGRTARFWTSSLEENKAWRRSFAEPVGHGVERFLGNLDMGYSARCIKS